MGRTPERSLRGERDGMGRTPEGLLRGDRDGIRIRLRGSAAGEVFQGNVLLNNGTKFELETLCLLDLQKACYTTIKQENTK